MEGSKLTGKVKFFVSVKGNGFLLQDVTFERKLEVSEYTIQALKLNDAQSRIINDNIKRQQKQDIDQIIPNNNLLVKQQIIYEQELRKAEESEERETIDSKPFEKSMKFFAVKWNSL